MESRDEQFLTTYILDELLAPRKPKDALAYVALTKTDLWPGGTWSFVFGQASFEEQTGVWSLARYGESARSQEEYTQVLRRTLKVASHEIGHVLGVKHCITHQCNMNGSMHLEEADTQPLLLCPHCLAKLMSSRGCSLKERFQNLSDFSNSNGLFFDAARFDKSAELLD